MNSTYELNDLCVISSKARDLTRWFEILHCAQDDWDGMPHARLLEWVLRIAVAGEFLGHGVFALQRKAGWFKYFEAVGISDPSTIGTLLTLVGVVDLAVVLIVLLRPIRIVLLWAAVWGLWTAMIRWPVGPDPVWDFVERWTNWGAPLALLLLRGWPKSGREWFR